MHRPTALAGLACIVALGVLATASGATAPATAATTPGDRGEIGRAVIADYAKIASAAYDDAVDAAQALDHAVGLFLDSPSAETLAAARRAWVAARVPYAQSEAFRFADGPIEDVEGRINSWPIDENLIDYVEGEPDAGIVNHPRDYPALTAMLLASLNERGGEKNITTGFHAIEFLLWGQDLADDGPGDRPFTDYVDGRRSHADRRRAYLRIVSSMLVADLRTVADAWRPGEDTYRTRFVGLPQDEALARMLKGLGVLSGSELAGERLTVAYETKEQEDEHSCFSDNTQRDVLFDAVGIQNVYLGHYERTNGDRIEGHGVRELAQAIDPALAVRIERQVAASVGAARAVPQPFDRAILGDDAAPGRRAVRTLIASLRAQADGIAALGKALGLRLNF